MYSSAFDDIVYDSFVSSFFEEDVMIAANSKKWIVSFFAIVLAVVLLLSVIAYIIDPFFQFRVRDNSYMLSAIFVGSGLIKNYDYDTLIIGSSMIQNFDMDVFRNELGVKPLHVGLGAMRASEIKQLMDVAYNAGRAENFYICVDLWAFANNSECRIPEHLLRSDLLSRLHYLLGYEVWFRYIPVDVSFLLLDRLRVKLPYKFSYSKSIDRLDDWQLDYPPSSFGREAAISSYKDEKNRISDVETDYSYERMTANIDDYFMKLDFEKGSYTFFFPPYSSLYWCNAQDGKYFDAYLQAKQYFFERANEFGTDVYDFQCADFTVDLDNYKDTTHFTHEINDWMVKCFAGGEYLLTEENRSIFQEKLIENTNTFRSENEELFK